MLKQIDERSRKKTWHLTVKLRTKMTARTRALREGKSCSEIVEEAIEYYLKRVR